MVLIDARKKFLTKKISTLSAEKLYDLYVSATENDPLKICDISVLYLKAFIQYPPNECLRIIRTRSNQHFAFSNWGDEYLYLLSSIAAYHLDKNERTIGITWAVKTLDLVDYFCPNLTTSKREFILYNMPASSMVCAYPKDFNQSVSDNFFLDWEVKRFNYYGYKTCSNDI